MSNPEITSHRIKQLLLNHWYTSNEIVDLLQIKDSLDKKYLSLKLKELNRKGKIVYVFYTNDIYWKKTEPAFVHEDEEISSYNLFTDFYSAMTDKNPEDLEAWEELGYWYGSVHLYDKAISCYSTIIDIDPTDAEIWKLLGDSYEMEGELETSILCYKNALRFVDTDTNLKLYLIILLNMGEFYYWLEDYKRALRVFKLLFEFEEELNDNDIDYFDSFIAYIEEEEGISLEESPISQSYIEEDDGISLEESPISRSYIEEEEGISLEESQTPDIIHQEINQLKLMVKDQLKLSKDQFKLSQDQKKLSENRNIILAKSYVQNLIKPYFDRPSKKQIRKLENLIGTYKDGWPDDMWKLFVKEFYRAIERHKKLEPSKWKKWAKIFVQVISKFPIFI